MSLSGISNESAFGKVLRLPLRLIPAGTRMTVRKGGLKGKQWIVESHTHGCWLGTYESEKQLLFGQTITKGSVVFDVGANVGFYTLLASTLVGTAGHVYAFEPLPRNISYLKEHLRLNRVENVTVIEAAVADYSGVRHFDKTPGRAMGHLSTDGALEVRSVALDELIASGQVPAPDFMKIDVEGDELLVLAGAQALLSNVRPSLFLATHGVDVHRECCERLRLLHYDVRAIDGRGQECSDELFAFAAADNVRAQSSFS